MPWNSESKITIHGARSVLLKGSLCNGGSRGGGAPPLFLDQTEFRKAEKKIFVTGPPPYLRVSMIAPPPPKPPYLTVWIRHCFVHPNDPKKLPA